MELGCLLGILDIEFLGGVMVFLMWYVGNGFDISRD